MGPEAHDRLYSVARTPTGLSKSSVFLEWMSGGAGVSWERFEWLGENEREREETETKQKRNPNAQEQDIRCLEYENTRIPYAKPPRPGGRGTGDTVPGIRDTRIPDTKPHPSYPVAQDRVIRPQAPDASYGHDAEIPLHPPDPEALLLYRTVSACRCLRDYIMDLPASPLHLASSSSIPLLPTSRLLY